MARFPDRRPRQVRWCLLAAGVVAAGLGFLLASGPTSVATRREPTRQVQRGSGENDPGSLGIETGAPTAAGERTTDHLDFGPGEARRVGGEAGDRNSVDVAAWLGVLPRAELTDEEIDRALHAGLERDEHAVEVFLRELPAGDGKWSLVARACEAALARHQVGFAVAVLAGLEPESRAPELLARVAAEWGRGDYAAAVSWAMEQADPALQEDLLARIVEGRADVQPSQALFLALAALPAGDRQDRTAAFVVMRWAERSMTEASAAVATLPGGSMRDAATRALLGAWYEYDCPGAWDWALARPSGAARDNSVARLAALEAEADPERAATLALREITGESLRVETLAGVLATWVKSDRTAAQAWVSRMADAATGDVRL